LAAKQESADVDAQQAAGLQAILHSTSMLCAMYASLHSVARSPSGAESVALPPEVLVELFSDPIMVVFVSSPDAGGTTDEVVGADLLVNWRDFGKTLK
jgi:hypothetical protein